MSISMKFAAMIKVAIVDDDKIIARYLSEIVSLDGNCACIAVCHSGKEAIDLLPRLRPHVVLMDLAMPEMNGIECIKILKHLCKGTEFMICTIYDEDEQIFDALEAGANAYILKRSEQDVLIAAIKELHDGGSPMSSDIARKIVKSIQGKINTSKEYSITSKEEEVLRMLTKGHSYQEIADLMNISVKTLKKHVYNIYSKLQVHSRTEAINKFFGRRI